MTSPQQLAERALDLGACPPFADPVSRRRGVLQYTARELRRREREAARVLANLRESIAAVEVELAALGVEVDHAG